MPSDEVLVFQCPKCGKRLKAQTAIAGRRVKCPKCEQPLKVPGVRTTPEKNPVGAAAAPPPAPAAETSPTELEPIANGEDDWLNLRTPAIADVQQRQQAFEESKAAKDRERALRRSRERLRRESSQSVPAQAQLETPAQGLVEGASAANSQDGAQPANSPPSDKSIKRSIFDDDLPELAELQPASKKPNSYAAKLLNQTAASIEQRDIAQTAPPPRKTGDRNSLNTDLDGLRSFAKRQPVEEKEDEDPEYRILCTSCGTPQYVRRSSVGEKIQCPDCYLEFKIPPPAASSTKKQKLELSNEDIALSAPEELHPGLTGETQQSRASRILKKAEQQVTDEDIERLYDYDFDTVGFIKKTFGFLQDPMAIAHIVGFAIIFAGIFALGQFGANGHESAFGQGVMLMVVIGVPVVALVFAMPMLSSGIAVLESVANRQPRVADWPGFNLFENAGDMVAITVALVGSTIPGFLLGSWIGGDLEGAGRIQIAGMMLSSFALFPVILLSMLDNGSVFAPLSSSVVRSFTEAAEAWASYFLKTFIAFSCVMLMWFLLLGKGEGLAALAGCLLPLLVFFTCQQLGALADGISEQLSIEFTPRPKDQAGDEPEGEQQAPARRPVG